ncbi:MAG: uracil-DNA glycosylase family protein [Minisyncoccia bacterium]|jgi:DNA polymerase
MPLKLRKYKNACIKLNGGNPVFIPESDPKNGTGKINIMFINERPGPKTRGTDLVCFDNPDPTARLFKHLFEKTFGLEYRSHIFITNAVIWVPDEAKPRNYKPTNKELRDSLPILKNQIETIKPKLIVSLGNSALYSLKRLYSESQKLKGYKLTNDIGKVITDTPISIYPAFHTSSLGQVTRNKKQQEKDWLKMRGLITTTPSNP